MPPAPAGPWSGATCACPAIPGTRTRPDPGLPPCGACKRDPARLEDQGLSAMPPSRACPLTSPCGTRLWAGEKAPGGSQALPCGAVRRGTARCSILSADTGRFPGAGPVAQPCWGRCARAGLGSLWNRPHSPAPLSSARLLCPRRATPALGLPQAHGTGLSRHQPPRPRRNHPTCVMGPAPRSAHTIPRVVAHTQSHMYCGPCPTRRTCNPTHAAGLALVAHMYSYTDCGPRSQTCCGPLPSGRTRNPTRAAGPTPYDARAFPTCMMSLAPQGTHAMPHML